jgi:hypothetical protein
VAKAGPLPEAPNRRLSLGHPGGQISFKTEDIGQATRRLDFFLEKAKKLPVFFFQE